MGKRIATARDRAGMTQAELASAISIDRSAVAKIESGARRVSALELAGIAEAVGERIEWFVTEMPAAIVSHRNLAEPGTESPETDRVIERVAWNVEFVGNHDDRFALRSPAPMNRPGSFAEADEAAAEARGLFGLNRTEPFCNMAASFTDVGLLAFSFDLGPNSADAASILLGSGGVAVVDGHLRVGRRRLALAHELGHYLFADEYAIDWRIEERDDSLAWESRVDRFARGLLLPREGLEQFWHSLRRGGDSLRTTAVKTASRFRVDMSTLARRLYELSLVNETEAGQIRKYRTTRADIVELNLVTDDELAAPFLARAYEEAVLRLYRQEVVSAARATDLLFDTWNDSDLPELPELPESAIWDFV